MKACPFCGEVPDLEDDDTLYPSGIYWRISEEGGHRVYLPHWRRNQKIDGKVWKFHCVETSGGCGATVSGHSRDEAIANWNRRTTPPHQHAWRILEPEGWLQCHICGKIKTGSDQPT